MGYLRNQLATVITGIFAAVLTGLWPIFYDYASTTNLIFMISVPITWFLTFACWMSQKSIDYLHKPEQAHTDTDEKLEWRKKNYHY